MTRTRIIFAMSPSLYFENKKYISAREASTITGYSKDYIGQLARANKIKSRRVGRNWYVCEESILNYKNFSNETGLPPEPKLIVPVTPSTLVEEISPVRESVKTVTPPEALETATPISPSVYAKLLTTVTTMVVVVGIVYASSMDISSALNKFASLPKGLLPANVISSGDSNPDSVIDAYKNYVTDVDKNSASVSDVLAGYRNYIKSKVASAVKATTAPVKTVVVKSGISQSALISALRELFASDLPEALKQELTGPRGPQGEQGPAGATGYTFTAVPPSSNPSNNNNGAIGLMGGFANLGVQNLTSTTIRAEGDITQTSGTARLKELTTTGLTVNGNTTLSGDLTITGNVNPGLTPGSVFFQGPLGITQDNANFFFDDTTNRLGLGNAAPTQTLDITGTLTASGSTTLATGAGTTNTFGSGDSSINIIGSTVTPGALTLHGATTLDNTFDQTGAFTFSTGTGAVSLNGNTSVTGTNTFTVGTGLTTLGGNLTVSGATTEIASTAINLSGTNSIIDLTTPSTLSINTVTNRPITTGTGLTTLGGNLTVNGNTISLAANTTIDQATGTLSVNTTNNRPVTFGTGLVTIPNLAVVSQTNTGTMLIDSAATTATIFEVVGNSLTSGTAIKKTVTANAGNGQVTKGDILNIIDSTTGGGGFTGIGVSISGAGTGSGNKYLLSMTPNTANNEVVFDNTGAFRPTTSVASNTATIGSPSFYWKNGYFDQVTANNIAGTVVSGATSSTTWTIGSTQLGDVNEAIIFQRNSGSGNATIQWNAGAGDLRYLSANYPVNTTYTLTDASIGTGINLFSGNLTNNTTGGTQKLLSLINTGTGTTENGIYISNTGTATTAIEVAGTWTNGLIIGPNGGFVGIGTTTPGAALSVVHTSGDGIRLDRGTGRISFNANYGDLNTHTLITANTGFGLAFATNGDNERVRITSAGNVGIASNNPSSALEVNGSIEAGTYRDNGGSFLLSGDGAGTSTRLNSENGPIRFTKAGDVALMTILNSGNVGIGTTTPGNPLSVIKATAGDVASFTNSGTSPLPIYVYSSDSLAGFSTGPALTDRAIYFQSGLIKFYNTADAMAITSAGRIGIGTTGPDSLTHIFAGSAGAVSAEPAADLTVEDDADSALQFLSPNTASNNIFFGDVDDNDRAIFGYSHSGDRFRFMSAGGAAELLTILQGGNVGIGTTNPATALEVNGAVTSNNRFSWTGESTGMYRNAANQLDLYTNGNSRLTILSGGNVGIATTNPLEKLDVNGNIRYNGEILLVDPANDDWALGSDTTAPGFYFYNSTDAQYRMVIHDNGNVGIGTTSPAGKLDINAGDVMLSNAGVAHGMTDLIPTNVGGAMSLISGTDGGTNYWGVSDTDALGMRLIGVIGSIDPTDSVPAIAIRGAKKNGTTYQALGASETVFQIQNHTSTPFFTALGSGNIGIGTTNPSGALQIGTSGDTKSATIYGNLTVANTSGLGTVFGDDATGGYIQANNSQQFRIITGGSAQVTVLSGGNVGIGSATPTAKLDVAGTLLLSGTDSTLSFNGKNGYVTTVPGGATPFIYSSARFPSDASGAFPFNEYGELIFQGTMRSGYNGGISFVTGQGAVGNTIAPTIKVRITEAGNVGIGTTTPGRLLDVNGITRHRDLIYLGANDEMGALTWGAGPVTSTQLIAGTGRALILAANNSNTTGITITTAGNVGISTSAPLSKLSVTGGAIGVTDQASSFTPGTNHLLEIRDNDTGIENQLFIRNLGAGDASIGFQNQSGDLWNLGIDRSDSGKFKISSTTDDVGTNTRFTIDSSGNVGIATASPNTKLEVAGTIRGSNLLVLGASGSSYPVIGYGFNTTSTGDLYNYAATDYSSQLDFFQGGFRFKTAPSGTSGNAITYTTALSILQSGNVGVGTATPGVKFEVSDATNPSIQVIDSTNNVQTRIQSTDTAGWLTTNTNHPLNIATNGTAAMTINTSQNVGIGSTSPRTKLDVIGDAYFGSAAIGNSGGGYPIHSYNTAFTGTDDVFNYLVNDFASAITTSGGITFSTAASGVAGNPITFSPKMTILNGGNVGIGTTSPNTNLEVNGTIRVKPSATNGYATISGNANGAIYSSNGDLLFYTNNTVYDTYFKNANGVATNMIIKDAGNVGIGTTNPLAKLEVYGTMSTGDEAGIRLNNPSGRIWRLQSGIAGVNHNYFSIYDVTGAASRLTINDSGNVGIGTTNPGYKLDIRTSANNDRAIYAENTSVATGAYGLYANVTGASGTNYGVFSNATGATTNYSFYGNAGNFYNAGNVGVGTTAPTVPLHVAASAPTTDYVARFVNMQATRALGVLINTNTASATTSDPVLRVQAGGATLLDVQTSGNVGIGTTDPGTSRLYINGSTNPTSLTINNSSSADTKIGFSRNGSNVSQIYIDTANSYFDYQGNMYYRQGIGGTTTLTMSSGGSVGIGTTSPNGKLDLRDGRFALTDADVTHGITDRYPTNAYGILEPIYGTTNGGLYVVGMSDTDSQGLQLEGWIGATDPVDTTPAIILSGRKKNTTDYQNLGASETVLGIRNGTTDLVSVLGGGNVGIGTTAPGSTLDVNGIVTARTRLSMSGIGLFVWGTDAGGTNRILSGAPNIESQDGAGLEIGTSTGAPLVFYTNQGERMRILSGGNVGIGTSNPSATLHVVGSTILNNLYSSTDNSISLSTAQDWIKLGTIDRYGYATIRGTISSTNSEETFEIDIKSSHVTSQTSITVNRQSYNARLVEVRAEGADGANKVIFMKVRTSDFGANVVWKFTETTGTPTIHNTIETPVGATYATLLVNGNAATNTTNKLYSNGSVAQFGAYTTDRAVPLAVRSSGTSFTFAVSRNGSDVEGLALGVDASNRGLIGSNNADTYLGSWASGVLSTAMTIQNTTGNIGIGTTNPGNTLVLDRVTGNNLLQFNLNGTTAGHVGVSNSVDNPITGMTVGDLGVRVQGNDFFVSTDSGGTGGFVVKASTGFVGIRQPAPANFLHITTSSSVVEQTQLTLEGGTNGYGAGVGFSSRTTAGGTLVTMAKITADGEDSWSTTASTQDAGLRFFTSLDGTLAEKMRINGSGNVGIGTTSISSAKLQVASNGGQLLLQNNNSGGSSVDMQFRGGGSDGQYNWKISKDNITNGNLEFTPSTAANGTTFTTPALVMLRTGYVGVGTTAPGVNLEVHTPAAIGGQNAARFYVDTPGVGVTNIIGLYNGQGSSTSNGAGIAFQLQNSGAAYKEFARITALSTGVTAGGSEAGQLSFSTMKAGTITEQMRIDNNGNVGIGTTTPGATLHIRSTAVGSSGEIMQQLDVSDATAGWLRFQNGTSTDSAFMPYIVGRGTGTQTSLYLEGNSAAAQDSGTSPLVMVNGNINGAAVGTRPIFQVADAGTPAVTVDASGRLLVGATLPTMSSSQVFEATGGMSLFNTSSTSAAPIYARNTDTTAATNQPYITLTDGGGNRGGIGIHYTDSALWIGGQAGIRFRYGSTSTFSNEAMRIDSSGNLAIGTTSASSNKVMVQNNVTAAAINTAPVMRLQNSQGAGNYTAIHLGGLNQDSFIGFYDDASASVNRLDFAVSGSTIDVSLLGNGNFGIGTTTPATKLDIVGGGDMLRLSDNRTDLTAKYGMIVAGHYTNAEENLLLMYGESNASVNNIYIGGGTGQANTTNNIRFFTASNQTTTTGTERMRIDSSGNVGIGTTSPDALLHLSATNGSNVIGHIGQNALQTAGNNVLVIGQSSDYAGTAGNAWNMRVTHAAATGGPNADLFVNFRNNADSGKFTGGQLLFAKIAGTDNSQFQIRTATSGVLTDRLLINQSGDFDIVNGATTIMRVANGGNVGIGTTGPNAHLDIQGTTGTINLKDTDATSGLRNIRLRNDADFFYIEKINDAYSSSTQFLTINNSTNNVGIGTTTPGVRLELRSSAVGDGILLRESYAGNSALFQVLQNSGDGTGATLKLSDGTGVDKIYISSGTDNSYFNGGGNIGIGTTGASYDLDINKTEGGARTDLRITNLSNTASSRAFLDIHVAGTSAGDAILNYGITGTGAWSEGVDVSDSQKYKLNWTASTSTNDDLAVGTNVITATTAGNVGIGTTNPVRLLTVDNATSPTIGLYTNGTERALLRADTSGNFVVDTGGNQRFSISSSGIATFLSATGGTFNASNFGINFKFGGSGSQYGMQFLPVDSTGTSLALFFANSSGSGVGSIQTTNTGTAYITTSDQRLKQNIVDTNNGLQVLNNIKVRDFDFIDDQNHETVQGFIAQELYDVYPQAVTVGGDDARLRPWGVDYGKLSPLIVKAVQELDLKITGVEERLAALEQNSGGTNLTETATEFFASGLKSMVDGVAYLKGIVTETLTVGSAEKPAGITLFDPNGAPYCVQLQLGGVLASLPGTCESNSASAPSSSGSGSSNENPENSGETPTTDTISPVITLNGDATINLTVGDSYSELGATANDDMDGGIMVIITGNVDTAVAGTYTIHYQASDSSGNMATEITRTVIVSEPVPEQ